MYTGSLVVAKAGVCWLIGWGAGVEAVDEFVISWAAVAKEVPAGKGLGGGIAMHGAATVCNDGDR
jgi:hypothetical protein